MSPVVWTTEINFASALLLHSCMTVLLKEMFNILEILRRLSLRFWIAHQLHRSRNRGRNIVKTSIVLDAYTSVFSRDVEGELSELYFTNTGFVLLGVSLASSVAMNLLLSSMLLNTMVAATFGVTFLASLVVGDRGYVLPILALRRAGRFIWSDTPFVNFFSLIYIATVLRGRSTLRLQDYIIFRSIAVLELVFMKARLAASSPDMQAKLLRQLVASEWTAVASQPDVGFLHQNFQEPLRDDMIPFTTSQRLSVMLFKTSIGFQFGCLKGSSGPASCPMPEIGYYVDVAESGWRIYRISEDSMLISDCDKELPKKGRLAKFIAATHGILLRQLGKIRVIYLLRAKDKKVDGVPVWHSNINLVTGVTNTWLEGEFRPVIEVAARCVVA